MRRATRSLLIAALTGSVAAGAAGVAIATNGPDDDATDVPISAEAIDKASAAALKHTGEGRVTETEQGDEESLYEVEVTLDNGDEVDVQLDENFQVVGDKTEKAG